MLNNEQRVRIVGMTPAQRTQAWTAIASQMAGNMNNASATGSANMSNTASARSTNIRFVSNARVQPTPGDQGPPPPTAQLPICEPMQQDNCINRGAR